jgi:glycosyltransferase involved in cell wall biosynthesis
VRTFRPDVAHVHNIFFAISPSVFFALRKAQVPIVWTLHNYRLFCANALMLDNGRSCNKCLSFGGFFYAIRKGCRDGSPLRTLMMVMYIVLLRARGVISAVDVFVALSEFSKKQFIAAGVPPEKIIVKRNFFLSDAAVNTHREKVVLYAGALVSYKGVFDVLDVAKKLPDVIFVVAGDGADGDRFRARVRDEHIANIRCAGFIPSAEVSRYLLSSACLLFPSICSENCPRIVIEAMAAGTPVVSRRLETVKELLGDEYELFFDDTAAAAADVVRVLGDAEEWGRVSGVLRQRYLTNFTARVATENIESLYERARASSTSRRVI